MKTASVYQANEFAELAGVTVRALHHYDRLGLLKPSGRTNSGYRLYTDRDLVRLEQIVVLKFLGLPLKQIRTLLDRHVALAETLRRQQNVLADKRRQLDAAIHAIRQAEQSLGSRREPDWELFKRIIREVEMQNDTEWGKKYYSPEAQAKIDERKALWSPELQEKVTNEWKALLADVEAALSETPASPKAQALAARWKKLVDGFTGGDPEVQKGLNKMWADKANWPAGPARQFTIKPETQAFIAAAMKAAKRDG
ncbi:MAG TPA: MerR family transcriptional regulator [Vicinamibacterales bacterium]|nr:MerR family transcriptional regulator [Vicinamibacterales bacterium]